MTRAMEDYIRACVKVAMDEPVGRFTYLYWLRKGVTGFTSLALSELEGD